MKKIIAIILVIAFAAINPVVLSANDEVYYQEPDSVQPTITNRAIVIIPGFSGSTLKNSSSGSTVWVNLLNYQQVKCNENGIPLYSLQSFNSNNYGALSTYEILYESLYDTFGGMYNDIIFFDYDWRLDCTTSAYQLQSELASYDEVVLVAHSMGGLVAARYLMISAANRAKTKAFISVGTPFVGTAKAIMAVEDGTFLDGLIGQIGLVKSQIKELSVNMPAVYQLLPTLRYSSIIGSSFLRVGSSDYTDTNAWLFLKTRSWAKKANGTVKPMFTTATTMHGNLYSNPTHVTNLSDVNCYTLAGFGKNTYTKITYATVSADAVPTYSNAGDGTVLMYSAGHMAPDYLYDNIGHVDLIKNSTVINRIKQIIYANSGIIISSDYSYNKQVTEYKESDLQINEKGWITNIDTKRINVILPDTATVTINNKSLFVDENDDLYIIINHEKQYVGSIMNYGPEKTMLVLNDDSYEIGLVNDNSFEICIEYLDAGYYTAISNIRFTGGGNIIIKVYPHIDMSKYSTIDITTSGDVQYYRTDIDSDQLLIINQ